MQLETLTILNTMKVLLILLLHLSKMLQRKYYIVNSFMTEAVIIEKPVHQSMDWFLYDDGLRHERVKHMRLSKA